MDNVFFKPGHVVKYGSQVGTIIAKEEKLHFKPIVGEVQEIYHSEASEITLSDEQFRNMGFEIIEDVIPCKSPILKMFTVLKLNTNESDFTKFDYHFPKVSAGVISYKEGTEFIYSLLNRRGKTRYSSTCIKTITDLQDALEANGYQIEFDEDMLWKIEKSLKN
jgi:hypothetical protein